MGSLPIRNKLPSPHFLPLLCLTSSCSCSSMTWTLSPTEKKIYLPVTRCHPAVESPWLLPCLSPSLLGSSSSSCSQSSWLCSTARSQLQTGGRNSQSSSSGSPLPGTHPRDTVQIKENAHNIPGLVTVTMTMIYTSMCMAYKYVTTDKDGNSQFLQLLAGILHNNHEVQ